MTTAYEGVACSAGVAAALGWCPRAVAEPVTHVVATPRAITAAFEAAAVRLLDLAASYRRDGATTSADILETEAVIALDRTFSAEVVERLESDPGRDAAVVVIEVADRHAAVIEALPAGLRERAADIREVGRRVVDELTGRVRPTPPPGQVVLVADEVCAPDLLEYADRLVGAVSVRGGSSSHASIVARSLGLPFVSGVDAEILTACAGVQVTVDGDAGRVVVDPSAVPVVAAATSTRTLVAAREPATTRDGVTITLLANVASTVEARRCLDAGAEGVGLVRTELAFLDADAWPTRAQHEAQLRPLFEVLAGRSVTVRLLDFSNDKTPPFLSGGHSAQQSPAILRGPREALDAQLGAILAVGRGCDVRVLVPMVTRPDEINLVRERLAALAQGGAVPPVGAMVESPEAVDNASALADAADFLSIGTNDLTATTLGLERTDPRLEPALAAHPAVLAHIERVVQAADVVGKTVSVCGDAAARADVLPLLLQAGVRVVSVAPSRLDAVRALVREQSVRRASASGRPA